jgi:hypothetical protein
MLHVRDLLSKEWHRIMPEPTEEAWEGAWREAVRSACHSLVASHGAIEEIELKGKRWAHLAPRRLIRMIDLAREIAAEYGLQVADSHIHECQVVRITSRWKA